MYTCEIYIGMNEDGEYVVHLDEGEVLNKLAEDCGGCQARVVKVIVHMNAPVMAEAETTVPDDAGTKVEIAAQ